LGAGKKWQFSVKQLQISDSGDYGSWMLMDVNFATNFLQNGNFQYQNLVFLEIKYPDNKQFSDELKFMGMEGSGFVAREQGAITPPKFRAVRKL